MKKTKKLVVFLGLLLIMLFQFFPEEVKANEVYILCYHHFVEDKPEGNSETTLAEFKKQMEYLKENNFEVLSLQDFLFYYEKGTFPEKSVMLTFDDGYLSFFNKVFPVLQKYDFPAVVFPIVSHMPGLQRTVLFSDKMSFNHIRYMNNESGLIDVGSHSYDLHYYKENNTPAITQQPSESLKDYECRIRRDLATSRNLIEMQMDTEVIAIAWPYGVTTEKAQEIAKDLGFKVQFELGNTPFTPEDNLLDIPRFLVDTIDFDEFVDFF